MLTTEQTSSDLTTRSLFNDSPVLFLETSDQTNITNTNTIEQVEQVEVHTPPDNTNGTPPPPKKRYEIMKVPLFFLRVHFFLQYLVNLHFLQTVTII